MSTIWREECPLKKYPSSPTTLHGHSPLSSSSSTGTTPPLSSPWPACPQAHPSNPHYRPHSRLPEAYGGGVMLTLTSRNQACSANAILLCALLPRLPPCTHPTLLYPHPTFNLPYPTLPYPTLHSPSANKTAPGACLVGGPVTPQAECRLPWGSRGDW